MKVKTILVTQPKPEGDKSPYFDLEKKCKVKVDFRPFIQIDGISGLEFRKQKVNILEHTAVIITSRSSIDHYFRMCKEMRVKVPEEMKFFCISESTAYYIQKYIQYRKRKVFYGSQTVSALMEVITKHRDETFLLPCSDIHKEEIAEKLEEQQIKYTRAVMYRTVAANLKDLENVNYDVLVFFSPSGIKSLYKNFPKFKQNKTRIACFGPTTAESVKEAGLKLDIHAPTAKAPSMTMALEQYILSVNKAK